MDGAKCADAVDLGVRENSMLRYGRRRASANLGPHGGRDGTIIQRMQTVALALCLSGGVIFAHMAQCVGGVAMIQTEYMLQLGEVLVVYALASPSLDMMPPTFGDVVSQLLYTWGVYRGGGYKRN